MRITSPPADHFSRLDNFDLYEVAYTQNGMTHVLGVAPLPDDMPRDAINPLIHHTITPYLRLTKQLHYSHRFAQAQLL